MPAAFLANLLLVLNAAVPPPPASASIAAVLTDFQAGHYAKAARALPAAQGALRRNQDYYLYFLGESQFYAGDYAEARATFTLLGKARDSRLASGGPWRVADCLWMEGKRENAVAAYRKLLGGKSAADEAVARYRVAEVEAEHLVAAGKPAEAAALFMKVHVDFPAHPLGEAAGERATRLVPAMAGEPSRGNPSPAERLQRAATLSKARKWQDALDELSRMPASLPDDLAAQRDLAMGMAKYHERHDYAGAAALLLKVASRLGGEKAAFAAFHGARALSRIDHDDEAIENYRKIVARYPGASWAAEAQFRAGWLEVNHGNFRAALPDLRETLARYPKSAFADDAAWYLALAHFALGESAEALAALAQFERVARRKGEDATLRALYWRARVQVQMGQLDEAKRLLHECAARSPFHYYALLAQARLRGLGEPIPEQARPWRGKEPPPLRDAGLDRALELEAAGLDVEAGIELVRAEPGILKRHGKAAALPFLLATYPRLGAFYHAHRVAESAGQSVLGDTRLFWESSYPRAFPGPVAAFGKAYGVPELFVDAIMRKESSYHPFAISPSDARGLLQLIPNTSAEVAKHLGIESHPDELLDPETNIRLGTAYLGGLLRRFRGQEALAAGAYNAGARAMMRWCDQWGGRPLDEFVELITYDQAREYIKRVLGIYARYRQLYGEPLELSLTVNAQYLKDGFDF